MTSIFLSSFEHIDKNRIDSSPVDRGFPVSVSIKSLFCALAPRIEPVDHKSNSSNFHKNEEDNDDIPIFKNDPYQLSPTHHLYQGSGNLQGPYFGLDSSVLTNPEKFLKHFRYVRRLKISSDHNSITPEQLKVLPRLPLLSGLSMLAPDEALMSGIAQVILKELKLVFVKTESLGALVSSPLSNSSSAVENDNNNNNNNNNNNTSSSSATAAASGEQHQENPNNNVTPALPPTPLQASLIRLNIAMCVKLKDLSALAQFKQLLELSILDVGVSDFSVISKLSYLRVLEVNDCNKMDLDQFFNAVSHLECLSQLCLTTRGDLVIKSTHIDALTHVPNLQKVRLSAVASPCAASLAQLVNPDVMPDLRDLHIVFRNDETASFLKLAAETRPCTTLARLSIPNAITTYPRESFNSSSALQLVKKFPLLQHLAVKRVDPETDFTPLAQLSSSLLDLGVVFKGREPATNVSLRTAISQLLLLRRISVSTLLPTDFSFLKPLRRLEIITVGFADEPECFGEVEEELWGELLDLVDVGHLPVLFRVAHVAPSKKFKFYEVPRLLRQRSLRVKEKRRAQERREEEEERLADTLFLLYDEERRRERET